MAVPAWTKKYPTIAIMLAISVFLTSIGGAMNVLAEWRWWVNRSEFTERNKFVDGELKSINGAIMSSSQRLLKTNLSVLRGQLWDRKRDAQAYREKGQPVPLSLLREINRLARQIAELERALQK